MSEGSSEGGPINPPLKKGEYITPEGRRVRDAHFMLEEESEREIDEAAGIVKKNPLAESEQIVQTPGKQKHTRGYGAWEAQDSRFRGTEGGGTPRAAIPHPRTLKK